MQRSVKKWIKKRDLVGHSVTLSYNGNGNVHQTFLGGAISTFVLMFMLWITWSKSFKMVTHGDDDISKVTQLMTPEDLDQQIKMNETRLHLMVLAFRNGKSVSEKEYNHYVSLQYV